jgi:hypothetical protein
MIEGAMPGFGYVVLFLVPFIGVSLFTAVSAVRAFQAGDGRTGGVLAAVAVAFGLASTIVLARALSARPRAARLRALRQAYPAEPWMWREDWAAGRSESEPGTSAGSMVVFAVLVSLLTAFLFFFAPEQLAKASTLIPLHVMLPVISVVLIVVAGRRLVSSKKFGSSVLVLAAVPAPLGGRLEGAIETSLPRGAADVVVRLACIRITTTTSGEDRNTTEHLVWHDEQSAPGPFELRPASRIAIPVRFDLPAEALPTQKVSVGDEIVWRLEAAAALPGVDYAARFDVPVFAVAGASAPAPSAPALARAAAPLRPSPASVHVAPTTSGGTAFWFGPARNPGAATSFTVFVAIFGAALWIQLRLGVPIFPFITGAVLLLILLVSAHLWTGTSRVVVEKGTVTITKTLLGVPWTRRASCADITDVRLAIGMSTGSRAWYDLKLARRHGPPLGAGSGVGNKREAEWLAAELKQLLRAAGAKITSMP